MKIPILTQNKNETQKLKKSIWQLNTQTSKCDSSSSSASALNLQKGLISQRSLKLDKTRMFKPCNTLNKTNTRTRSNNNSQTVYDENSMVLENKPKQNYRKCAVSNNENIICVLEQLESYEKIKINNTHNFFNTKSTRPRYSVENDSEPISCRKQTRKEKESIPLPSVRQPFADITNITFSKLSQNQNTLQDKQYSMISTKPCSQASISQLYEDYEDDQNEAMIFDDNQIMQDEKEIVADQKERHFIDETERMVEEKMREQNIKKREEKEEESRNNSIASTNISTSAQSVDNHSQKLQNPFQNNATSNLITNNIRNTFKQQGEDSIFKQNEYLDGYKIFKKNDKLFTFKVFKEDYLKIPAQFAPVITHSQDDDVSSDEDVVRGGIKFNYKSILKEIYNEEQLTNAPQLVLSNRYFQ